MYALQLLLLHSIYKIEYYKAALFLHTFVTMGYNNYYNKQRMRELIFYLFKINRLKLAYHNFVFVFGFYKIMV